MTRRRYQPRKQVVTRFVVAKDYYCDGHNMREDFPVLYGTQAEAEEMMAKLNAGSDISFFDASDEDAAAFLYVDTICVERWGDSFWRAWATAEGPTGVGRMPLDAIRDLLDREDSHKRSAETKQ